MSKVNLTKQSTEMENVKSNQGVIKPVPPLGPKPVKSGILKPTSVLLAEARAAKQQALGGSDFPLDMFPPTAYKIVEKLHRSDGFCVEYTAMSMLTIAASLIGSTRSLRVHGKWSVLPSLFTILVGKPGMGKTPPINALLEPLERYDDQFLDTFIKDTIRYKKGLLQDKPTLKQMILNDFSPEKFISVAAENPRGTLVHCDEIISLFLMADRYNKGVFLQQLLSMFSGGSLKVSRKEDDMPLVIRNPSINIIGGIQTNLIPRIGRYDSFENGMADRFCFVYPRNQEIQEWSLSGDTGSSDAYPLWETIVDKLARLTPNNDSSPKQLEFTPTARLMFVDWYNRQVRYLNANPDEEDTRSRKQNAIVARLCIILHELGIACGDISKKSAIDCDTLECAIKIGEWLNDSWERINEYLDDNNLTINKTQQSPISSENLYLLRESSLRELTDFEFTAAEARNHARKIGIGTTTMKKLLQRLIADNKLFQPNYGVYHWRV